MVNGVCISCPTATTPLRVSSILAGVLLACVLYYILAWRPLFIQREDRARKKLRAAIQRLSLWTVVCAPVFSRITRLVAKLQEKHDEIAAPFLDFVKVRCMQVA